MIFVPLVFLSSSISILYSVKFLVVTLLFLLQWFVPVYAGSINFLQYLLKGSCRGFWWTGWELRFSLNFVHDSLLQSSCLFATSVTYIRLGEILLLSHFSFLWLTPFFRISSFFLASSVIYIRLGEILLLGHFSFLWLTPFLGSRHSFWLHQ